ncbi:unnamed protein product [Litomosoides sigmodontis]|uniref:PHD-type domain-containing protein n=1 Tax=Litomosoides sigmodontis TaxID=42156 RepID=A0A3P6T8A7_LITSI|nr:unnamed protein product [Litomosoides sigmodontis]
MDASVQEQQHLEKAIKTEQEEKGKTEQQTHCLCGSSDESSFMICCDHCGVWYHGACLQVTRTQANRIETYACPPCISKDNNLKIVYRALKKEREKSVHREKQCKSKCAKSDIKNQRENKSEQGCNNCINCFRSTNCGKCVNCSNSVEPCLKRICLQSEWWNKHKKKQQQIKVAGREGAIHSIVNSVSGRCKKERVKCEYTSDDDGDNNTFKGESGSSRLGFAAGSAKRTQRKVVRKRKTAPYQRRQANTTAGKTKKSKTTDFSFTTEQRQKIASAIYNHRSHRYNQNEETAKHCEGPQCTNSTRSKSKFCCEECGMNLARDRLRSILPDSVKSYWDNMSYSMEQSQRSLDAAEEQIQFFTIPKQYQSV